MKITVFRLTPLLGYDSHRKIAVARVVLSKECMPIVMLSSGSSHVYEEGGWTRLADASMLATAYTSILPPPPAVGASGASLFIFMCEHAALANRVSFQQ